MSDSSSCRVSLKSDHKEDVFDNAVNKSEQYGIGSPMERPSSSPDPSSRTPEWSIVSMSPRTPRPVTGVSAQDSDWNILNVSPRQSPPIQMMGQPSGYDPKRIPSSIFSSKPTSPMEWSVASNESLFSIQIGNNSFSRDHAIMSGKSGELTNLDKSNSLSSLHPITEAMPIASYGFSSSLPAVSESVADNGRRSADIEEEEDSLMKKAAERSQKTIPIGAAEDNRRGTIPSYGGPLASASTHRLSCESGTSAKSFAFPVLGSEGRRSNSVKVVPDKPQLPEKPESPPQTPGATSKLAEIKCFSCFSYGPICS